jgi:hypothetical protein
MEIELIQDLDEIKEIANLIRKEQENLFIYVDKFSRIIIEKELQKCETMFSIMNIMEELKNIQLNYMPDFSCTFEMWMNKQTPVIFCTYERNKIN